MTDLEKQKLGKTLWAIADQLRGAMNADDFRDYMLAFLFLRYLSDNYEAAAKKELGPDYPELEPDDRLSPLSFWYSDNAADVADFEKQMRRKVHYVIEPQFLWGNIAEMARTQNAKLLHILQQGFDYIENQSFASTFKGLFSEINLASDKLGKTYAERNARLCKIIGEIARGLAQFSTDSDTLGDAYEYLIGQFAAGSGKKAGEFYTPQPISSILSAIVTLDVYAEENLFNKAIELGQYWEDSIHKLKGLPNVVDIRNFGLIGAIELAPRSNAVGARAFDVFNKCFHDKNLLIRTTGDIIALSPPLILQKSHIDEIFSRLADAIKETA